METFQTSADIEDLNSIFEQIVLKYSSGVKFFKSNFRIVCHFDTIENAFKARQDIQEQLQPIDVNDNDLESKRYNVRQPLVRELALLKCYFRSAKQSFAHFEREWTRLHPDESVKDCVQRKLESQLKENPCILSVQAALDDGMNEEQQDLYIVCATTYDLRLLSNYSRGTVALTDKERITFRSLVATTPSSSPPTVQLSQSSPDKPPATSSSASQQPSGASVALTAQQQHSKSWVSISTPSQEEQVRNLDTSFSAGQTLLSAISTGNKNKRQSRQVFVFWDVDACPVSETDLYAPVSLAAALSGNINEVVEYCTARSFDPSSGHNHSPTTQTVSKILYLPTSFQHGAAISVSSLLEACLRELTSNQHFRSESYSRKSGAEHLIRGEIDTVLETLKGGSQAMQPLLCFILSHQQFATLVSCLKLAQLKHIVLIHQSESGDAAFGALGVRQLSWSQVRGLHALSKEQKVHLFEQSSSAIASAPAVQSSQSAKPVTFSANNTNATMNETKVDLKHTSLAVYFKLLIEWRQRVSSQDEGDEWTSPLFGETGEAAQSGFTPVAERTAVSVDAHPKGKKFFLVVSGHSLPS
eukprot:gene35839-44194_t